MAWSVARRLLAAARDRAKDLQARFGRRPPRRRSNAIGRAERGRGPGLVVARARPESVRLTESYSYDRVIARHHMTERKRAPTGQIRIVVPYDGERYFGRQAYRDVRKQLGTTAPPEAQALIGHLTLVDDGRTDLASVLDLSGSHGSVPLTVPVTLGDIEYPGWLRGDRHTCLIEHDYQPEDPPVVPIQVEMQLLDEEGGAPTGESLDIVSRKVAQSSSFHPDLLLGIEVTLRLPSRPGRSPAPRVKRIRLDWPTITSLRGLDLTVGDETHPLAYDPTTSSLSWTDVPIDRVEEDTPVDFQTYRSKPMLLAVHQPGELYQQDSLSGQVEVEVPGRLLSGLQARLFDGTGHQLDLPRPRLTSRLVVDVGLVLDEAFARRELKPYQFLHFDEVIPDAMRLSDIRAALQDQGFRIEVDRGFAAQPTTEERPVAAPNELDHLLVASHWEQLHELIAERLQ